MLISRRHNVSLIIYNLECTFMLWRNFVILFTLRPSDLNTALTYVLMDNFLSQFYRNSVLSFILMQTDNHATSDGDPDPDP